MSDNQVLIQIRADVADINAKLAEIKGEFNKVRDDMGSASNKIKNSWQLITTGISSAIQIVKEFKEKISGIAEYGNEALEYGDKMSKLAQATGVGVATLSALSYAAQLADVETEALAKGIAKMEKSMFSVGTSADDSKNAFSRLGVSVKDSDGKFRSAEDVFGDIAEKFAKMPDGVTKSALAMEIFGKSGTTLIPLLNEGRDGLEELRKEAEELGLVLDPETAQKMEQVKDNFEKLHLASRGLAVQIMSELLPSINQLLEAYLEWRKNSDSAAQSGKSLKIVLQGMASGVIAIAAAFDLAGTAIGEYFGKASLENEGLAPKGISSLSAKLESYKQLMKDIWNPPEVETKTKETGRNNTDDTPDRSKALDAWKKEAERLKQEIATSASRTSEGDIIPGLDDTSVKIGEIISKAEQMRVQFAKVAGSKDLIDKWEEAKLLDAELEQGIELLKNQAEVQAESLANEKALYEGQQANAEYQRKKATLGVEKELNEVKRKRTNYQVTDVEMQQAEIKAQKELIKIETERLSKMDQTEDLAAYQAKREEIARLTEQLKDLESVDLSISGKVTTSLRKWADEASDLGTQIGDAFTDAFDDMADTLADFVTTGEADFKALAQSILKEINTIIIKWALLAPLANALSGNSSGSSVSLFSAISSLFTSSSGTTSTTKSVSTSLGSSWMHGGGIVGLDRPASFRMVPRLLFEGAPRFHTGLAGDEFPAILQKGESVFTEGQTKALGNMMGGTSTMGGLATVNHNIINISAADAKSFSDLCKRNPNAIAGPILQALQDNRIRKRMKELIGR